MKKVILNFILFFSANGFAAELSNSQGLDTAALVGPDSRMNCDIMEVPACKPPAPHEGMYDTTSNGLPTKLIMNNKGAYNVRYTVVYRDYNGGPRREFKSASLPIGKAYSITMPSKAYYAYIRAEYHTGFGWSKMYQRGVCYFNNKWTSYDDTMNIFQIDNWGATISPKWKIMQAKDTYYNGVAEYLGCAGSA